MPFITDVNEFQALLNSFSSTCDWEMLTESVLILDEWIPIAYARLSELTAQELPIEINQDLSNDEINEADELNNFGKNAVDIYDASVKQKFKDDSLIQMYCHRFLKCGDIFLEYLQFPTKKMRVKNVKPPERQIDPFVTWQAIS
ncbi:unnamed protein product [Porites evermanni]|uniref:Uncharacterized protein n=1 Tax=Porites evermanni TaxID=104178 RepID=A0ABN8MN64_9CNID|nr:unnamed protein product [Porites evermanni]